VRAPTPPRCAARGGGLLLVRIASAWSKSAERVVISNSALAMQQMAWKIALRSIGRK